MATVSPVTSPAPALVIAAGAVLPPLCTCAVGARFYARRYQRSQMSWDDWLTIPALLLLWGQGLAMVIGTALKSLAYPTPPSPEGVDPNTYSSFQSRTCRQIFWAMLLMQIPALTCNKLSIVSFYRRIFVERAKTRIFDSLTLIVMAVLVGWAIAFFFSELFICKTKFSFVWESKNSIEEDATCLNLTAWDQAFTASDFILDLVVLVLPIHQIIKLQMSLKQRLAVIANFSLGAVAVGASIARLVIFTQELRADESELSDVDLIMTACLYWTMLESGLGLVAACLPSIYGLCRKIRENSRATKTLESYESNGSHANTIGLQRLGSSQQTTTTSAKYWRTEFAPEIEA